MSTSSMIDLPGVRQGKAHLQYNITKRLFDKWFDDIKGAWAFDLLIDCVHKREIPVCFHNRELDLAWHEVRHNTERAR